MLKHSQSCRVESDTYESTLPAEADVLFLLVRGVGVCAYCPVLRLGLSAELVYA